MLFRSYLTFCLFSVPSILYKTEYWWIVTPREGFFLHPICVGWLEEPRETAKASSWLSVVAIICSSHIPSTLGTRTTQIIGFRPQIIRIKQEFNYLGMNYTGSGLFIYLGGLYRGMRIIQGHFMFFLIDGCIKQGVRTIVPLLRS